MKTRTRQAPLGRNATSECYTIDEPATAEAVSQEAADAKAIQANRTKCCEAFHTEHSSDKEV